MTINHSKTKEEALLHVPTSQSVSMEEVKWRELRKISMMQRAAGIKQIEDVYSVERYRVDDLTVAKNFSSFGNGGEMSLETKTQHR